MDSQKLDAILSEPCSYYCSASVPKWPQKQSQSISLVKFSWGSMPPDPPSLACLCMHTFTSRDTHVTPLLKIMATGLVNANWSFRAWKTSSQLLVARYKSCLRKICFALFPAVGVVPERMLPPTQLLLNSCHTTFHSIPAILHFPIFIRLFCIPLSPVNYITPILSYCLAYLNL